MEYIPVYTRVWQMEYVPLCNKWSIFRYIHVPECDKWSICQCVINGKFRYTYISECDKWSMCQYMYRYVTILTLDGILGSFSGSGGVNVHSWMRKLLTFNYINHAYITILKYILLQTMIHSLSKHNFPFWNIVPNLTNKRDRTSCPATILVVWLGPGTPLA